MPAQRARPAGRPEIGMVVVQPTAFCNINCTYCYLPDRNNKHVMAQSTVTRLFSEVFASGWAASELTVIWHAGEPLVVPVAFYREAFETIERLRPPSVDRQAFVPDQRHADRSPTGAGLFREWNVGVGVSIDGPQRVARRHRKTRSGNGTFDKTIAGIRCCERTKRAVPRDLGAVARQPRHARRDAATSTSPKASTRSASMSRNWKAIHVSELFDGRAELRARYAAFLRRFWHQARASGRVQLPARDRPRHAARVPARRASRRATSRPSRWPC